MKSIEEKAKAYDDAFKEASVAHKDEDRHLKATLERIFPELKESEDERISKRLYDFINNMPAEEWNKNYPNEDFRLDILDWLEKQGKNNIGISEATKQELGDNLNKALEKETPESWNEFLDGQCEQKHADKVEPKFKVGQIIKKEGFNLGFTIVKIEDCFYYNDMGDYFPFTDQDNWELVEQKLAWSEEDEKLVKNLISTLSNLYARNLIEKETKEKYTNWLKSLRPQPKQEWGEEDEMFVHGLIRGLAAKRDIHGHTTFSSDCIDITETINWLKSIKDRVQPQNRWKPSELQLECLSDAIEHYHTLKYPATKLVELLEQLKKLREE